MGAGDVISSLGTVREDRLFILGRRHRGRLQSGRRLHGLRRGFRRRRNVRARLVEHVGQFVEDGIASQAQLAQDFSYGAHNFGQAFGADHNQRDRENQNYFKKVQTSMTARAMVPAPCKLIIIPDGSVNDV
jgi:hypothetical protein